MAQASPAPREVVASAVEAVRALGREVVIGRYQAAIDGMNPLWKKRAAARAGGIEKLEERLATVAEEMVRNGISMISFEPKGEPRSFEVYPGTKIDTVDGRQVESLEYKKWMVLVPTVTRFRILQEGRPPVVIESTGFQVVVADKGTDDWTFIDGSGVDVNELRQLFITLPADLKLPPVEQREVK